MCGHSFCSGLHKHRSFWTLRSYFPHSVLKSLDQGGKIKAETQAEQSDGRALHVG
jgi:hypothetical protein